MLLVPPVFSSGIGFSEKHVRSHHACLSIEIALQEHAFERRSVQITTVGSLYSGSITLQKYNQSPSVETQEEGVWNSTPLYAHSKPYAYNGVMALCVQCFVRPVLHEESTYLTNMCGPTMSPGTQTKYSKSMSEGVDRLKLYYRRQLVFECTTLQL